MRPPLAQRVDHQLVTVVSTGQPRASPSAILVRFTQLQTLSFLAWLRKAMAEGAPETRLPILIVAPTSLLQNWEKEVENHLDKSGLGFVDRLYGTGLAARKRRGTTGKDTDDSTARIDSDRWRRRLPRGAGIIAGC